MNWVRRRRGMLRPGRAERGRDPAGPGQEEDGEDGADVERPLAVTWSSVLWGSSTSARPARSPRPPARPASAALCVPGSAATFENPWASLRSRIPSSPGSAPSLDQLFC